MQVYLIKTENGHSHDWGGEFYYDEEEAHCRAAELETTMKEEGQIIHFNVVKAEIIETTDKDENKIITNPDFWDCECKKNYIHRKNIRHCFKCGASRDEQPDSRQDEIDKYYIDNDIDIKED